MLAPLLHLIHGCLFLCYIHRSEHLLFFVGQEKEADILLILQLSGFTCLQIERLNFYNCIKNLQLSDAFQM